eukprot:365930-Chlamydomonas_euryale.AAC.11
MTAVGKWLLAGLGLDSAAFLGYVAMRANWQPPVPWLAMLLPSGRTTPHARAAWRRPRRSRNAAAAAASPQGTRRPPPSRWVFNKKYPAKLHLA